MGYKHYITGTIRIAPPLEDADVAVLRTWLQEESVIEALQGIEVTASSVFFDNDAPWRPGMDADLTPEAFAAGLDALSARIMSAGGLTDGRLSITSEGYSDSDTVVEIHVDDRGAILNGERVSERGAVLDLDATSFDL
ncbi:hypothetical protein KUV57_13515 [Epibacterium sp. DP7N7-1]|nr:hypothetical protein [Epibacterium sp. DP7N7-1]